MNPANIELHNAALHPVASIKDRVYLMSMLWMCFGTLPSLPRDIDRRTIFIDILMNDQNSKDIKTELDAAERRYRTAVVHIVLGTKRVFTRAWCLYEIAVRTEARKRVQLLLARGNGGKAIDQLPPVSVGPLTTVLMVVIRALWVPYVPMWICARLVKYCYGKDLSRVSSLSEMASLGALVKIFHNFAAEEEREFACANFFENMTAFHERDRDAIKVTALRVFGTPGLFNAKLKSTVVRSESSAMALSLIFWLELVIWPVFFPVHVLSAIVSFLLALLPVRVCCPCTVDSQLLETLQLGRCSASLLQTWIIVDMFLKPCLCAIVAAPVLIVVGMVRFAAALRRRCRPTPAPEVGRLQAAAELISPDGAVSPPMLSGGASPREVTSVRAFYTGFVPGFRVWTLEAYDGGELLVRLNRDMGSNHRKFKAFCEEVDKRGYELRPAQIMELSETLYLNIAWDNSRVPFWGFISSI